MTDLDRRAALAKRKAQDERIQAAIDRNNELRARLAALESMKEARE